MDQASPSPELGFRFKVYILLAHFCIYYIYSIYIIYIYIIYIYIDIHIYIYSFLYWSLFVFLLLTLLSTLRIRCQVSHFFPTVTRRHPSILLGIVWLCCMYPLKLGEWGGKVGGSAMSQSSMVVRRFHWKCRQRFYFRSDLDEPIENIYLNRLAPASRPPGKIVALDQGLWIAEKRVRIGYIYI